MTAFFDRTLKASDLKALAPEAARTESMAADPAGTPKPGQASGHQERPRITFDQVRSREDADKDERVTKAEFKGPPHLFQRLDRNGDGVLTAEPLCP